MNRSSCRFRARAAICYQPPKIDSVPIIEAVNELSSVDPRSEAVQAARALGISFGDVPEIDCPIGTQSQIEERLDLAAAALGEMAGA
ncbi:MAG: hypothetical protein MI757_21415 [Pirellulales bacterium]|nr:hypothetical protein [Pirellulales bacterium]